MNLKDIPKTCVCGKAMHISESQRVMIKQFGKQWPPYKQVKILGGTSYKVPTYYIILHGLKAKELPELGFEKWPGNI